MPHGDTTCWTMIQGAANGVESDRRAFVDQYVGVVRAYLCARWGGSPWSDEIDDAVQEVFVESFRAGGVLESVEEGRPGGFRAFLFGVVRNVVRRVEARPRGGREQQAPPGLLTRGEAGPAAERLTRVFDRAWARTVMREAAQRQRVRAQASGAEAERRVELLDLRFREGLPIRAIAKLWGEDPASLHRAYATGRDEFRAALTEVVAAYRPGSPAAVDAECTALLDSLGTD